jgi:hypothetical protein
VLRENAFTDTGKISFLISFLSRSDLNPLLNFKTGIVLRYSFFRPYSLTHAHRSIGYRNRNPQLLAESAARLVHLRVYDNRDSSHQSAPSPSLSYSLTHAHNTLPTPTFITITYTQVLWFLERLTRPTVSSCETTRTRLTICLPVQPSVCEAF